MFSNDEIQTIVSIVQAGGVILYPTDTIWGIGCNPFDNNAINRLFDVKQQNHKNGFVLLVSDQNMLKKYVPKLEPKIQNLLDYHTRPVTIVYDTIQNLPDFILANDGSIAIRIAQDDFCKQLITILDTPLVATAANIHNEPVPKIFSDISPKVIENMDYVVSYRQSEQKPSSPSVMIKMSNNGNLLFLRK